MRGAGACSLMVTAALAAAGCGEVAPAPSPPRSATAGTGAGTTPGASDGTARPPDGTELPPPPAPPPPGRWVREGAPSASAACAGLVPGGSGDSVGWALDIGASGFPMCDRPVTDGRGEWIGLGAGYHWYGYGFVRADAPGERTGLLSVPRPQYGGSPFAPQADGYHVVRTMELPGPFLRTGATGDLLEESTDRPAWAIDALPGGGSVLVTVEGITTPAPLVYRLEWRSGSGERRAEAEMPAGDPEALVSTAGDVLALAGGRARWYGRDGEPRTAWFPFDAGAGFTPALHGGAALADGSVVVGLRGPSPLRFEAAASSASPAPGWITSRAGAIAVAAVRGARATAFAFGGERPGCEARIEILAPDGELCGTLRLDAAGCGAPSFGADGTVFTTEQSADGLCTWRWWSGLLR